MSGPIRIVLADDHALVRRGLAALLRTDGRFAVTGEAGDGESALALVAIEPADLLILDISMPRMDGLETLRRVRTLPTRPKVLMLSMYDEVHFIAQALKEGADGYLLKDALDDELFLAIESVLRGRRYLSRAINADRVQSVTQRPAPLTTREREVLRLVAAGHTTQEVAELLHISPHTATRHRANLMQKLAVHNQVELVRVAAQRGLIVLPKAGAVGDAT
jgi:DNA-binding NarL/FixJ family response regulator